MAVTIKSIAGTQKQSIARVELMTDADKSPDDWRLNIHFEDGTYDANNALMGTTNFGTRMVTRRYGDIKTGNITLGNTTITVAQLAGFIQTASYIYRQEDIAAAANTASANTAPAANTTP